MTAQLCRGRAGKLCSADLSFVTKDFLLKIRVLGLLKCYFVSNKIVLSILSYKAFSVSVMYFSARNPP